MGNVWVKKGVIQINAEDPVEINQQGLLYLMVIF